MSTSFIYLNSSDRVRGTPYDFTINLNPANNLKNQSWNCSLDQATFMNSEYPINSKNNTFLFTENGASQKSAIIPEGVYDINTFMDTLKSKMEDVGALVYTITYDDITKKLSISANGNWISGDGSLNSVIGFSSTDAYAISHTSTTLINLSGTAYIDIFSSLSTENHSTSGNPRGSLLARIPIDVPFGHQIYWEECCQQNINISTPRATSIEISLYDDKGKPYYIQTDICLRLRIQG